MEPNEVNSNEFTDIRILYNHDGFSIVYGTYTMDKKQYIAMRWNGDPPEKSGFPLSSKGTGRPLWFIVDGNFTIPMLLMLQGLGIGVYHSHVKITISEIRGI